MYKAYPGERYKAKACSELSSRAIIAPGISVRYTLDLRPCAECDFRQDMFKLLYLFIVYIRFWVPLRRC